MIVPTEPMVLEMHTHFICATAHPDPNSKTGMRDFWFCGYEYLDGFQCDQQWVMKPTNPGTGQRLMARANLNGLMGGCSWPPMRNGSGSR